MRRDLIPVFAGPSLPPCDRPAGPFDWCAPARAGDVLAWIDCPPERMCLIDGLFDSCPAPWHKELLLLMAAGTTVYGASSMGALRAAELDSFGMVGVGTIYRAYRDGRITGDDEVALIHADAGLSWAPLSVPMVEMRATLAGACRLGLLAVDRARDIRAVIHDIHFESRDWPAMERACLGAGLIDEPGFRRLRSCYVPLKRQDALACLDAAVRPAPMVRTIPPPRTCFIRALARECVVSLPDPCPAPGPRQRRTARPGLR